MTKTPQIPVSCWNFYIHVDSVKSAVKRVESGGGKVLNGPMQVPGGSWIIQGPDPQGAMFLSSVSTNKQTDRIGPGRRAINKFDVAQRTGL